MAKRFLLAVICFLCCIFQQCLAQRAIGVIWEMPDDLQTSKKQLQRFNELGIRYLLINEKLPEAVWDIISDLDYTVYAQLPIRFPVVQTFSLPDSSFKVKVNSYLQYYTSYQSVEAVGFFTYGQIKEPAFREALSDFMQQIEVEHSIPLYYQTARYELNPVDSIFAFKLLRVMQGKIPVNTTIKAYLYQSNATFKWKLQPVKEFLEHTPQSNVIPVFFNSEWLLSILKYQPGFEKTVKLYANANQPVFALPENERRIISEYNALIFALLLAWIILAITYYISPVFRKSFIRYFTAHPFFVNDVMQRHIRTLLPGGSILAQHALLGGIFCYCIGNSLFSSFGFEALHTYYSIIGLFGEDNFAFFWWGFLITLLVEIVSIFWLHLANSELTHVSQIFNLYPWPLQLNIILATLVVAIFTSGGNSVLLYILTVISLLFFAAAFIFTAFDSAAFLKANQKRWFLSMTAWVYLLLIGSVAVWFILSPRLLNVLELAATLP